MNQEHCSYTWYDVQTNVKNISRSIVGRIYSGTSIKEFPKLRKSLNIGQRIAIPTDPSLYILRLKKENLCITG